MIYHNFVIISNAVQELPILSNILGWGTTFQVPRVLSEFESRMIRTIEKYKKMGRVYKYTNS